jgi:hypothetical protein
MKKMGMKTSTALPELAAVMKMAKPPPTMKGRPRIRKSTLCHVFKRYSCRVVLTCCMKFIVISVPAFVSHQPLTGEGLTTTVAADAGRGYKPTGRSNTLNSSADSWEGAQSLPHWRRS